MQDRRLVNDTLFPFRSLRSHLTCSITLYLCDYCTLEGLRAVHPSLATRDALGPVVLQQDARGEAGGIRGGAPVLAERPGEGGLIPGSWARAVPAVEGRRGSGEDTHHHVEGEEDVW